METSNSNAIMGMVNQVRGLFSNVNKGGTTDTEQIKPEDEYTSKMSDQEIGDLTRVWLKDYATYYPDVEKKQDMSLDYWLGKQKTDSLDALEGKQIIVNKLFEAIETFLPIATRSNPEPLVSADNSPEGQDLAKDLKNTLVYQADTQKLRRKLARMTRHWILYLIGALEVEYDLEIDDIKTSVINPKKFIFDKDGYVDESGIFRGEYLGIKCSKSASKLKELFPEHKEYIQSISGGKGGTKIDYIKWWYQGTDVFFTQGSKVLGKFKNPNWNYDIEPTDDNEGVLGVNHLPKPVAPYVFLSIFNLGLKPHDDTGLVLQNISQQDTINKRERQLDKNIDSQNNGLIVDGTKMNKEDAALAASALRKGASIIVQGNPNEVIIQRQAPQLAGDVWKALETGKQDLANIFGTAGSTPTGIKSEETARGKIMINQMDSSRIGGGVTEFIEQVADTVYNLWVQMMIVHYDNEHFTNILGDEGQDTRGMSNSRFVKSVRVTVKEGSLVPKDPLTQRNEAVDLWSQGAIDPLNFYKKLDFPDPASATQSLMLWKMYEQGAIPPEVYLPSFQINPTPQTQLPQEVGVGGPAVNAPTGQEAPVTPPDSGTQDAASIQSKQLISSVPIK